MGLLPTTDFGKDKPTSRCQTICWMSAFFLIEIIFKDISSGAFLIGNKREAARGFWFISFNSKATILLRLFYFFVNRGNEIFVIRVGDYITNNLVRIIICNLVTDSITAMENIFTNSDTTTCKNIFTKDTYGIWYYE